MAPSCTTTTSAGRRSCSCTVLVNARRSICGRSWRYTGMSKVKASAMAATLGARDDPQVNTTRRRPVPQPDARRRRSARSPDAPPSVHVTARAMPPARPSVCGVRTHRAPIDLTVADRTVACVVVTMNRPDLLSRCLHAVATQVRRPDLLVVVDNGDDPVVEAMLAASPLRTVYLPSRRNLGGAGGYAHGVLTALALGADWVWLADDDGCPADEWTLSRLLVCAAENELDVVSPLVLDEDDPTRLAFPLRQGLTWLTRREQVTTRTLVRGTANLFNGTLMSAHAVHAVGVPDPRLFVRGDEVEMHRRVRRSGHRVRHLRGRGVPAPAGSRRLAADPGRTPAGARPAGPLAARDHLPQPRLPDRPARPALAPAAGLRPLRVVVPRARTGRRGLAELVQAVRAGARRALPRRPAARRPPGPSPTVTSAPAVTARQDQPAAR